MTRRTVTARVEERADTWYFGPTARRRYEGDFAAPGPRAGETTAAYLERRHRTLARIGMSPYAVATSLRLEGRGLGDEATAEAVIARHERPNERE